MLQQTIACPQCNGPIPFNTQQLIMGIKFSCPTCYAEIAIATESKPLIEETMKKIEELKNAIKLKKIN